MMELWIRSQDKEILIKVEKIMIEEDENKKVFGVLNYIDTKSWFRLGIYKSKQRALEVLDEIQNILIIKNTFPWNDEIVTKSFENNTEEEIKKIVKQMSVYQMPAE